MDVCAETALPETSRPEGLSACTRARECCPLVPLACIVPDTPTLRVRVAAETLAAETLAAETLAAEALAAETLAAEIRRRRNSRRRNSAPQKFSPLRLLAAAVYRHRPAAAAAAAVWARTAVSLASLVSSDIAMVSNCAEAFSCARSVLALSRICVSFYCSQRCSCACSRAGVLRRGALCALGELTLQGALVDDFLL